MNTALTYKDICDRSCELDSHFPSLQFLVLYGEHKLALELASPVGYTAHVHCYVDPMTNAGGQGYKCYM